MKPLISIIMPAIRTERWWNVYRSIQQSTYRPFELIIVGPYALPADMQGIPNIKYVKDYGHIVRASHIAALVAEGIYITNTADDGLYEVSSLDRMVDEMEALPYSTKNIINATYGEAGHEFPPDHYIVNRQPEVCNPYVGDDCLLMMQFFMYTEYLLELGGFDCRFEVAPMANIDLSIRAYRDGANFQHRNILVQRFTHMPGRTGDHAPACDGQTLNDVPLFQSIHRNPETLNRVKIDINNWKQAPSVWTRRFGEL